MVSDAEKSTPSKPIGDVQKSKNTSDLQQHEFILDRKNNNPSWVMSVRGPQVVGSVRSLAPASNVTRFCNLRQPA